VVELPILIGLAAWSLIWLWAIFDANRYPDEVWRRAGKDRSVWLLLILVLQFFGTLFYLLRVRPELRAQQEHPGLRRPE
jgi:Phospholipase_D-nuclease N-terminal